MKEYHVKIGSPRFCYWISISVFLMKTNILHDDASSVPESKEWIEASQSEVCFLQETRVWNIDGQVVEGSQFLSELSFRERRVPRKRYADIRSVCKGFMDREDNWCGDSIRQFGCWGTNLHSNSTRSWCIIGIQKSVSILFVYRKDLTPKVWSSEFELLWLWFVSIYKNRNMWVFAYWYLWWRSYSMV